MNCIDMAVGTRIRTYRKALGMSQTELAERIGVRFQQIQKYENGSNRVAASRLWKIADALGISIVALFEDVRQTTTDQADVTEMLDLYRRLPPPQRAQALFHMRALLARSAAPVEASAETATGTRGR